MRKKEEIKERLDFLRGEIQAERLSYGGIAELQSLSDYIDPSDTILLEWAGIPDHAVRVLYPNGECPECGEKIAKHAVEGDTCSLCGHSLFTYRILRTE